MFVRLLQAWSALLPVSIDAIWLHAEPSTRLLFAPVLD